MKKTLLLLMVVQLTACATQQDMQNSADEGFTIEELKQQADVASYAGSYKEALLRYQRILDKDPNNLAAMLGAGESLLAAEQPVRADFYFARVLEHETRNVMAREGRALSWLMQGKYMPAKKTLDNLVDDGVDSRRVWNALGVIADLDGDFGGAVNFYKRAIELQPDNAMLYNNLGYSQIMTHNYSAAEKTLKSALLIAPGSQRIVNNLSIAIAWQERYDEAVDVLSGVLDSASSYNNVGYIAYLKEDYDTAEEYFQKAIRLKSSYYKRAAHNLDLVLKKKAQSVK